MWKCWRGYREGLSLEHKTGAIIRSCDNSLAITIAIQSVNPSSYPCIVSDLPWYSKVQNTITMTRPVFDTLTRPSIPQTNWAIHWARYKERRVLNKFDFDNGILFQCMSISISWKANLFTSWFKVWRNRCVCTSQIEMVPSVDPVAANASLFCKKSANHHKILAKLTHHRNQLSPQSHYDSQEHWQSMLQSINDTEYICRHFNSIPGHW